MPEELTRVTRYKAPDPIVDTIDSAEAVKPYTSVRCAKEAKEVSANVIQKERTQYQCSITVIMLKALINCSLLQFYTVVRNVKKAHQIQEIGEFQELNDDVEYILDALQVCCIALNFLYT